VHEVQTHLAGHYNLENILAAIAVGKHFGLEDAAINAGISGYVPKNNRSQIVDTERGNKVIGDFYNANASSMSVALENFAQVDVGLKKVLILGDMFELGAAAAEEHLKIYQEALRMHPEEILFVGENFYGLREQQQPTHIKTSFFKNAAAAREQLQQHTIENALILVKGSRGIALEKLMDLL
jgi:UDP-N-acetylmuramoyl-tripeptide--D-alanyl-D-alanine ligase